MKRQSLLGSVVRLSFILPALLLLLLLTGYPLLNVFEMSLYSYQNPAMPVFAGMYNYTEVIKDPLFWSTLTNTLVFTFGTVLLVMLLGMVMAVLLNQKVNARIRGLFRSVLMFPWLLSSAVVGSIWVLMLSPFGLINWVLTQSGVISQSIAWLSDPNFAMIGLILANVWRSFPFAMLMLLAAFQTVDESIQEAALVDGANRLQRFFYIVIPQIKGILFTVLILEVIWHFRTFDLIFLMTGGGPVHSTEVLSTYVYYDAFRSRDFGSASATVIFMLIVLISLSTFYLRSILSKEGK